MLRFCLCLSVYFPPVGSFVCCIFIYVIFFFYFFHYLYFFRLFLIAMLLVFSLFDFLFILIFIFFFSFLSFTTTFGLCFFLSFVPVEIVPFSARKTGKSKYLHSLRNRRKKDKTLKYESIIYIKNKAMNKRRDIWVFCYSSVLRIHKDKFIDTHTHTHINAHTYTYTNTHRYTHTRAIALTRTHKHKHTYTHPTTTKTNQQNRKLEKEKKIKKYTPIKETNHFLTTTHVFLCLILRRFPLRFVCITRMRERLFPERSADRYRRPVAFVREALCMINRCP